MLDPVIYGNYPPEMQEILGDHLPKFSRDEMELVKGSIDFISVNHYTTLYAKDCLHSTCESGGHAIQGFLYTTGFRNGIPIGEPTGFSRFFVVPHGIEMIIKYLKTRYNNKPMIFLENGYAQAETPIEQHNELLNDIERREYHKSYLSAVQRAMRNGADVRGYFVWSLLDNFEWNSGFSLRFGLYYVDYQTLKRVPKSSAIWYKNFLTNATQMDQEASILNTSKSIDVLSTPV